MKIREKTKIDDLLNTYPFLLDFFISKSPHFEKLKNPVMRKTMGKVATLSTVASIGKLNLEDLIREIAKEIERKTGQKVEADYEERPLTREQREEVLKGIIRDLHKGEDMGKLKQRFQELLKDVSPSEIASMEQKLIAEGLPESEVKRLCDVHVAIFKEALERHEIPGAPPGHPVHTFMKENRAAEAILDRLDEILDKITGTDDPEALEKYRDQIDKLLEELSPIHIHYLRKENQLFPLLEEHDISGPSQVMWAIHDDIRGLLKKTKEQLVQGKDGALIKDLKELVSSIREMIYKEEHILYPMALETLSDNEWFRVRQGEEEIGYAWVRPEAEWTPEEKEEAPAPPPGEEKIRLNTGYITRDLLDLMLSRLPVDITLVDEEDRVAYYSKGEERIFPRSPAIIGRKVQRCHPPDSVHVVEKILSSFRDGSKDVAEFWIQLRGRMIYIRYFALRDSGGNYKGCLEVSQDITDLKKLEGQKRLLEWE